MNRLSKILAVALILALVAGLAIPVLAADTKGKIASVAVERNQFVLTESFKNLTFTVDNGTKIYLNDRETKLADLKPGDEAFVAYEKQGRQLIATTVRCSRK